MNLPIPEDPDLKRGYVEYRMSCATCHERGLQHAPRVGYTELWEERIAQGLDVLYKHAIGGYQGKHGYMAPRGGNMQLSDEQVKAAVRYMVHYSKAENLPPKAP